MVGHAVVAGGASAWAGKAHHRKTLSTAAKNRQVIQGSDPSLQLQKRDWQPIHQFHQDRLVRGAHTEESRSGQNLGDVQILAGTGGNEHFHHISFPE